MLLAQELIDAIVDEIEGESYEGNLNLRSCCLAARPFVAPCQRRLFRSMKFSSRPSVRPYSDFPQRAFLVLTSSPHLRSYVRWLAIHGRSRDAMVAFASLIRLLTNIQHLDLAFINWASADEGFISSLVTAIRRPTLRCLTLKLVHNFPANLLVHAASSVLQLYLDGVSIDTWAYRASSGASSSASPLEDLRILEPFDRKFGFIMHPDMVQHWQGVRRLEVGFGKKSDLQYFFDLAVLCEAGLDRLILERTVETPHLTDLPALPRFAALRFFELRFYFIANNYTLSLCALLPDVPDLSSMPQLEVFMISIHPPDSVSCIGVLDASFDDNLASHASLREAHIRTVEIREEFRQEEPSDPTELRDYVCSQLPRARDKGLLKIYSSEPGYYLWD
ncbi:hypothetical protein FB451DRAFT_367882 [Mycena latifolia]|nr:hypothetical protein FB451DRAFT_367882 [Mycena latifolia]